MMSVTVVMLAALWTIQRVAIYAIGKYQAARDKDQ